MRTNQQLVRPFLKWAGGKRQLLPIIRELAPAVFGRYFEPFVGAGAVFFGLQPDCAVINDINPELTNAYQMVRDQVEDLIESLARHKNEPDYYYTIRNMDRTEEYKAWSLVERASRLLYINKTCFNGLFRTNSRGHWNVPFGRYRNPNIVNAESLRAISRYLNHSDVTILNIDFQNAVADAGRGDFVYLDPPYDPLSTTSSFTTYYKNGFNREEQQRLKVTIDDLTRRGCYVMLSNSHTDYVLDLYKDYRVITTSATRAINSNASKRGRVKEVLVTNYDPPRRP